VRKTRYELYIFYVVWSLDVVNGTDCKPFHSLLLLANRHLVYRCSTSPLTRDIFLANSKAGDTKIIRNIVDDERAKASIRDQRDCQSQNDDNSCVMHIVLD
jgi:hypothetical protein